jgi:hypothetical protein
MEAWDALASAPLERGSGGPDAHPWLGAGLLLVATGLRRQSQPSSAAAERR